MAELHRPVRSLRFQILTVLTVFLTVRLTVGQFKTERPPFSEFLNYGTKKVKPGMELGNEIIKSKVEVLGAILKRHVQRLRQVKEQRLELVFLVDSSASVGAENFFNELKFVKKLLADFAVSYNQTRVAVITFSSKRKVIRHIDHITQASVENHKCSLLDLELPRIRYSGGGTYTLGALLEAQSVIALARPDTVKAVFLVTDGYSNGGDPRPAADFLRARGVHIFTFGIRNGNVQELYDMASVPKEEHSYILDSFEEFEALARRALHEDLHSGVLVGQDSRACQRLCNGTSYCCDTYATCTCGTHTGHYSCTCRKGYYGAGLVGDCRPCPAGTYKDSAGPGDVSSCAPCPDMHMLSVPGSTSMHQCYCKRGYNQIGLQCQRMQCPVLVPPENGYFIRNRCNNVLNAACGIRCNPGFKLRGASIRLCGEDGVWSGGDPQCVMKSCPELRVLTNGTMICSHVSPTIDTECHFTCNPGFHLVGSKMRTCLPVAMWDGIPSYCKPVNCPALPPLRHGRVIPPTCLSSRSNYGSQCQFSCDLGFELSGPIQMTCIDPGVWSGAQKSPRCVDVTPPELTCPENQTLNTRQHENYALVTWNDPIVSDNSGREVKLATIPTTSQPMKLVIGTHTITYLAKDKLGNKASCQFSVTVLDQEAPRIDWCESPPIFLSHEEEVDVYWEEPIFSDNSGEDVLVARSLEPGRFPQGDTVVEYVAKDSVGNTATCNITITVQKHACQLPVDPINGSTNCTEDPSAIFCTLTCHDGYAFAMRPKQDYFCAFDGIWLPDDNPMPFPDCSVTTISNSIAQEGELAMADEGSVCDDIFFMGQVENQLEKRLEEALKEMCNEDVVCEVAAVEAVCENILSHAEEEFNSVDWRTRRRRGLEEQGGKSRRRRAVEEESERERRRTLEGDMDLPYPRMTFEEEERERSMEEILSYYWPTKDSDSIDDDDDSWVYWTRDMGRWSGRSRRESQESPGRISRSRRESQESRRIKRGVDLLPDSHLRPVDRRKRQFGFSLDHLVKGKSVESPTESPIESLNEADGGYVGTLITLITQSMSSDLGVVRFGTFLANLKSRKVGNTANDFILAFSEEFGEDKARLLRELASRHLKNINTTFPIHPGLVNSGEDVNISLSTNASEGEDSALGSSSRGATEKAFKVKFKVEGHGSGVNQQLESALNEFVQAAQEGQFDLTYGERQLRVAAIRLREHPEVICDPGSVLREGQCVKCPVGTFYNVLIRDCLACPVGSFQPLEGQVSCLICPTNTSTKSGNAKSYEDCKAQCLPGSFSGDGLEPCTTCEIGYYQDQYASSTCISCPHETTTWRRGSWLPEECQGVCEAGEVSETGLEPCLRCPVGSFQSLPGEKHCLSCPGGGETAEDGSTSIHNCSGVGSDDEAAAYANLQTLPVNDCFSNPCRHLASCVPMQFGYVCSCPQGYTGQHCETEIDECESEPCYHNATCLDLLGSYYCDCTPGYNGSQCEVDINECNPDPCANEATCVDLVDGFRCVCQSGYTGEICDTDIDECAGNPCASGATCVDLLNDFMCVCAPGDTGRFCETHINECESSPCAHGLCLDRVNNFSCVCEGGYTGLTCEEDIDDCASHPCRNDAMCTDWLNGFSCSCSPGFSGKLCDQEMPTDFLLEFPAADILNYAALDGPPANLSSASVCFWMRSGDGENYGTPFSYATSDYDNAFTITDYNGFVLYVNGEKRITDVKGNDGEWHMICLTWRGDNGTWEIYLDGEIKDSGEGLANGTTISGSGTMVLGQEQDASGGGYSPQESFIGQLTLLNVWGEALTSTRIRGLYTECQRYVGSIRGWPDFQAGIKGQVVTKPSTFCRGCGVPSVPTGGHLQEEGSGAGSKLRVICNEGFKLSRGQAERECLVYGEWSGQEPVCERVQCGFAGYLLNGYIEGRSYSYGDTVRYICNPGFVLRGERERVCQADGKWSGEKPDCEMVRCPHLNASANSQINNAPLSDYLPSHQVRFSCMEGYQMDGPSVLTCGGDGEWDGEVPSCQSHSCNHQPNIANGLVEGEVVTHPGGQAVVKCLHGYQLKGEQIITCEEDGTWSLPLPKCIRKKCLTPPDVKNGRVRVRASTSGQEAVYRCDAGYVLEGAKILTCEEGEWSAEFSKCLGLPCPSPETPPHASLLETKEIWRVGDNVTYQCEVGYKLDGYGSVTCSNNGDQGEWQGQMPTCVQIMCPAPSRPENGAMHVTNRSPVGLPVLPEVYGEIEFVRRRRHVQETKFPVRSHQGITREIQEKELSERQRNTRDIDLGRQRDNAEIEMKSKARDEDGAALGRERRSLEFPSIGQSPERSDDDFPSVGGQFGLSFPPIGQTSDYAEYDQSHGFDYTGQSVGQSSYDYGEFGQESHSTGEGTLSFGQTSQSSGGDYEDFGQSSNSLEFSQTSGGFNYTSQTSGGFDYTSQTSGDLDFTSQTSGSLSESELTLPEYPYGTEVGYDCRPGFKLLGEPRRMCSGTGEWDAPEPRCYEQYCPDLPSPTSGRISYIGSGVGSRAVYICDEGYNLVGDDPELLCQADQTWLGDPPVCQLVDCGDPADIGNGTVEFAATTFGSTATYDCFFGFVLEGSVTRYCSSYGRWNGTLPRCEAVTCLVPPVISNGYITFEGSLYVDSPIEYECKECFKINGTAIRHCRVDGTWSLEEPTCHLIYCDELPATIPNGRVIGEDNSCGSLVEYECQPGYERVGPQHATCLDNEKWSSPAPSCERISCGAPESLTNGRYAGDSFLYTDKVTYECDEGHILQGPDVLVCEVDGTWSDTPPFCAIVNCTKPQWPSNGKVRLSGLSFGAYANVVCDPGFTLGGEDTIMCGPDGMWDKPVPQCIPVICPPAPQVLHGTYNSTELQFEAFTVLRYDCEEGYEIEGESSVLTCTPKGHWDPENITCGAVDCGDPGTLPFGTITGSDYTFGHEVRFSCREGYKLLGPPSAKCLSDASWSNYATACLQIICPEPEPFEFGSVTAEDVEKTFGTSLIYECNSGYILQGNRTRTCSLDGEWTGSPPYCEPVTCPEPEEAVNAVIEGELFEYNQKIRYTCAEGYNMLGDPELVCQADGSWSHEAPICEMIICPDLPELEHGTWKARETEDQPVPPEPLSTKRRKGHAKGRGKVNQLSRLQSLLQVNAGEEQVYKFGQLIEAECEDGYAASLTTPLVCTNDGWAGQIAQCHAITCPIPVQIRRGTLIGDDYTLGATINYTCDEGHDLIGVSSRICQENKEWSDTEPFCREVECPQPALLQNGRTIGSHFKYRAILTYQCDPGFRLEGVGSRVCQSDGHWSGKQPVCVEMFCDMPAEIPHAVRDVGSLKVGGTVRYSCMEGYRMEGWSTINCISEGTWDAPPPTCVQIDCGPPPTSDSVVVRGSATTYGSQVTFRCQRGYRLSGPEWSTCLETGRWSAEAPLCDLILCLPLPPPPHGSIASTSLGLEEVQPDEEDDSEENEVEMIPSSMWGSSKRKKKGGERKGGGRKNRMQRLEEGAVWSAYKVDGKITFRCDEGFQSSDPMETVCEENGDEENGKWSNAPPVCRRISCGSPELPDNAELVAESFLYRATATYTCREGYVLMGDSTLICQANGEWSSITPSCPPVSCGPPSVPIHTKATYVAAEHGLPHSYGSTIAYACEEGYELVAGEYQTCESDAQWHGPEAKCEEMRCQAAPPLSHGVSIVSEATRPQTATFRCDVGYNLVGPGHVECRLGSWMEHNTTCEPINCYEPPIPPFGKITAKHFTYGTVANYSCIFGYMLVGNPSVRCAEDASWVGGMPACLPVNCGAPEAVSNGEVTFTQTSLGSHIRYQCHSGYQLFGDGERECTADATWSGDQPQCHRKDCGEIEAPQNGFALGAGSAYEDWVRFGCERGFKLEGEGQVQCLESGLWSSSKPVCTPVKCDPPTPPPNAIPPATHPWKYQDRINFDCEAGHLMRGDLSTTCLHTGQWTRVLGQCSKISCGRPKINTEGVVILGRSFFYGEKVIYRCPPGKAANGSSVLTCQGDGSWSENAMCVGKCSRKCFNGGVCLSNNICTCPPGYVGDNCQHAVCVAPCLNGGTCIAPYKCRCLSGYSGPRCQTPVCEAGCGDGGSCIGPNVCHCFDGSVAPDCNGSEYYYPEYYSDSEEDRTNFETVDLVHFRPPHPYHRPWRN